jgi:hypothetical protein
MPFILAKTRLHRMIPVLLWALAGLPAVAVAQWTDSFDTLNPAWVTDRYAPAGFQVAPFLGDNRLQITIDQDGSSSNRPAANSSAFYNTQGDQRAVGSTGGWALSAEVYVSSAFDTTTGQLVRTDLWARTGTGPGDGMYAIIGFTNASPTDPLNPDALDRAFRFEVFNGTQADPTNWFNVGVPTGFTFDAWHTVAATFNGTTLDYSLDGQIVFTNSTVSGSGFQTAFIQAYNFGQTGPGGLNSYAVYWDNASAAVPEPASLVLITGLGVLGMAWMCRRVPAVS